MTANAEGGQLRRLPSVDRLLREPRLLALAAELGHEAMADAVRWAVESERQRVLAGDEAPDTARLVELALARAQAVWQPTLLPVINATGVIMHTNLGRAPLSAEALAAVAGVARGYSNLEYDLDAGERGSRHAHVSDLLARLTGAEAAHGREQQRRGRVPGPLGARPGARGDRLARPGGRDWRRLSHSRRTAPDPALAWSRSAPRTAPTSPTTRQQSRRTRRYCCGCIPATSASSASYTRSSSAELGELARARGLPVLDDLGSGALLDTARLRSGARADGAGERRRRRGRRLLQRRQAARRPAGRA